jgi:hypothetical protein
MTPRRLIAVLSAAACLLLAAGIPASAAGGPPRLLRFDDTTRFAVRPATLAFGADGGVLVLGPRVSHASFRARRYGHIRWNYWRAMTAHGVGTVWINQCRPTCAAGHYVSHPVVVVATRVVHGHYTRLALSYESGRNSIVRRYVLERFGSLFGWQ